MPFFPALLKFFKKILPEKVFEKLEAFTIKTKKIDNSKKFVYNDNSKNIIINISKLDSEEKKELGKVLREAIEKDYTLLHEDSKFLLDDVKKEEEFFENKKIIQFLKPKIYPSDLDIWRGALYLRSKHKEGDKKMVKQIKGDLIQRYGERGKNIANLCSANYIKDYFIPLYSAYEEYYEDEGKAREKFRDTYKLIVNEQPFTIFVSHLMSIKDIKNEIEKRKKYGLEFINIHGIGEDNKKKIEKVTSEFSKTGYYKIERYISEEKNVIFIRITRKSSS